MAACNTASRVESRAPRRGPVVLPAGVSSYFAFETSRVSLFEDGALVSEEAQVGTGRPIVGAIDLNSAWAVVGYEHKLAFVQLSSHKFTWISNPLGSALDGISIRGETAILRSGSRALAMRVPAGTPLWNEDLSANLKASDVANLQFAVPQDDDNEIVILATKPSSAWTNGVTKVQRLDRSKGDWRLRNESSLPGFTRVHQAASDGEHLYIAGLREETQRSAGGMGRLWQWLVISRISLESLEATELVYSVRQARETYVSDLVIGVGAVAVLLDGTTVQIYRLIDGGQASAPIFERTYPKVDSIAWISEEELVVQTSDGPMSVKY
ncbi:MAG: hypothetical protein ACI8TQ_003059 [Planctomycetota bacterium]|jgi:hypothetical protein